jgi:predicted ATPase/DNA-binding CsgD family transcriptional regulator
MSDVLPTDLSCPQPVPLVSLADQGRLGAPPPVPLTTFVGREQEVTAVANLLQRPEVRLVTLTGPGGVGKTRLAIAVADQLASAFPDGVGFVSLESIADSSLAASATAQVLGIREMSEASLDDRLVAFLHDQQLLLVLDNFEQVVEAAPLVTDLLGTCPKLTVLITSRVRLRVSGEREHVVPPLPLTGRDDAPSVVDIARSPAVQLFVERAQAARSEFVLSDENASVVADICRRLDGLPLAIELAAARMRALPPNALLDRLERRLPLLTGGVRDAPTRQRTMRDAVAWSYDLLTPAEQRLFRRLAVFVSGCTLEAAEAVTGEPGGSGMDVLDGIASLVDKSLLRQDDGPGGASRYRMLETVREFGLEQLAVSGEEAAVRDRHAAWCLAFGQRGAAELKPVANPEVVDRLETDHANLRAALAWLDGAGHGNDLLRLTGSLEWFWYLAGHYREGHGWLERALALAPDARAADRTEAENGAGHLAYTLGDFRGATEHLDRAMRLARETGAASEEGRAMVLLGILAEDCGDYDAAEALLIAASELWAGDTADPFGPLNAITIRYHLGVVAFGWGDLTRAETCWREAVASARRIDDPLHPAWSLNYLILLAIEQGDRRRAAGFLRERVALAREFPRLHDTGMVLAAAATLASVCGEADVAARLFGAATSRSSGTLLLDVPPEGEIFRQAAAAARRVLGDADYAAAWEAGQRLRPEEVDTEVERVLAVAGVSAVATAAGQVGVAGLTSPELDVLRLLVAGRSNPEIGEALFISPRTAQTHVTNILAKLAVTSRTEAAAVAVRDGLV